MNKNNFINCMRLFFAILVIANHIHPLYKYKDDCIYLTNLYNFIISFAVPFFLLTTGFFIGKKIKNIEKVENDEILLISKNIQKILKLYILFTIIYLPLTIYGFIFIYKYSFIKSIIYFIRGVLFVGENFQSWILWYLLSAMYGLMFITKVLRKTRDNRKVLKISGVIFILGIMINCFLSIEFKLSTIRLLQKILRFIIPNGRIFYSFIFIPAGIYLSKK